MGCSEKVHVVDGGVETEGKKKKWVIAGILVRAPLKQIRTKKKMGKASEKNEEDGYSTSTTPTSEDAKISEILPCPPPPRKRRPSSSCNNNLSNGVREFFNPPDLESVFIRRVET